MRRRYGILGDVEKRLHRFDELSIPSLLVRRSDDSSRSDPPLEFSDVIVSLDRVKVVRQFVRRIEQAEKQLLEERGIAVDEGGREGARGRKGGDFDRVGESEYFV